jgi:hypothetical protein
VEWSVEPATGGTIDSNGMFQVSQDAQYGEQITVRATFPDLDLSATVTVFTPESNPLVGTWVEREALPCDSGDVPAEEGFNELVFEADNTFTLTWYPFELYYDYWGTYTYDPQSGQLAMSIVDGNYIPESVDLEGIVEVQADGSVRLRDMYFGPPPGSESGSAEPTCGYIIE